MNETLIFFKIQAVFKKKIPRLKLYLPRKKWTKNETLIFFKIRSVIKKIETEAEFTKTEMNYEWNVNFL